MISFKRIRDIREDNDLTQKQMAEILGVKRSAYSLWELGINIIPIRKLVIFADYFDYSLDYILGLSNNKDQGNLIKGINFKVLGYNLKKIRLNNGYSQEDMAYLLKVSSTCIVRYEKAYIEISLSNLYEYVKLFKVSINDLCGKSKTCKLENKKTSRTR